jgi:hypothetical protein
VGAARLQSAPSQGGSYYPITAYEAQSGQILRVRNRPGNVHDGKAALGFLRTLFAQLAATLNGYRLEFRMDSAFFRRDIIELVEHHGAEYAIKVPFDPWVGLKEEVQQTYRWERMDDTVSCGDHHVAVTQWRPVFRVVVFRKRLGHATAKNSQLDLFDPTDGHYEYSAVVTNKPLSGPLLWAFMCGRGAHEKAYAELKSGFAFDCVPTMKYAANSLWQLISVMAFNVVRAFQALTIAERPWADAQAAVPLSLREHSHLALSLPAPRWRDRPPRRASHARCRLLARSCGALQTARPPLESGVVSVTSGLRPSGENAARGRRVLEVVAHLDSDFSCVATWPTFWEDEQRELVV